MDKLNYKISDYIVIFLFILIISAASNFSSNVYYLNITTFILLLYSIYKIKKIRYFILVICIYALFIELASNLYLTKNNRSFYAIYSYLQPILLSYSAIIIIGKDVLKKLEAFVFYLAIISLPLFLIQIILPNFMDGLYDVFGQFSNDNLRGERNWYAFVFNYLTPLREDSFPRNSGFMWEPGAYALVLIIFIIIRFNIVGCHLKDKHIIFYIIALLTTFSTSGYLSVIFIFIPFILNIKNGILKYIYIVLFIFVLFYIFKLDFMNEKINSYIQDTENFSYAFEDNDKTIQFNRYLFFVYVCEQIVSFPIGYGTKPVMFDSYSVIAPNGFANILYHWGIIGLLFVVLSIKKFVSKTCNFNNNKLYVLFFTIAILIPSFSNPVHNNPIIYLIVLTPYISLKTHINNKK